eukprot:TRINITY_DN23375_c0_g2_i1.p1 TRINITY_DN23375_c0_g2~~TRINITY_DN23375_c0_g2_i1.p1  ORF type:complete len:500 (+),score=98.30 TRINITY_DN23375_c0_g2_i1:35-1534(+)
MAPAPLAAPMPSFADRRRSSRAQPARPARPMAARAGLSAATAVWLCALALLPLRVHGGERPGSPASGGDDAGARGESTWVYGNLDVYAYYFVDLLVGSPEPQRVSVIVDTGSSLCGFPCDMCEHCGKHLEPAYRIKASRTAAAIPCGSDECDGACQDDVCTYGVSYAEGSSVTGFLFKDEVQLADAMRSNEPVNASLGCHVDERKLFYSQWVNGIFGLAPRKLTDGQPTVLHTMFRQADATSFSMCLSEWGGVMTVGDANSKYHTSGTVWTELNPRYYYYVHPVRLSLGDQSGHAASEDIGKGQDDFGETIVDSGTTYTQFSPNMAKRLRAALQDFCRRGACGARPADGDCWHLDEDADEPRLPPLIFTFRDGARITWPSTAYLRRDPYSKRWCAAFGSGSEGRTVLGLSFMLHKDIFFDLKNRRLGVSDAKCPEKRRAPDEAKYERTMAAQSGSNYSLILLGVSAVLLVTSLALFVYSCFYDGGSSREQAGRNLLSVE